jgi:hypothetical protein
MPEPRFDLFVKDWDERDHELLPQSTVKEMARKCGTTLTELYDWLIIDDFNSQIRLRREADEFRHTVLISVSRWEPIDLGPVLRGGQVTQPPTVFERVDGVRLLYARRLNLFMGETESMKTWLAQVAVAQELQADHHVIYVDYEDGPETIVERLRALGVSAEEIERNLTYLNPGGRFDELAQAVVTEALQRRGVPSLCVVDGVTEAMSDIGLDPLKGTDVAGFYAGSPRWLANTGAAVVLIDHVTKDREGRGRWAIGSERKLSGLDGAAYGFETLEPFGRGKTGRVKITVAKDRCGHVRRHETSRRVIVMAELKSWPDDGVTVSLDVPDAPTADGSFRPTHLMEQMSKAIVATPGLTSRALRAAVSGKSEYKDLALELLIIEGYVEVEDGPNRAKLHRSTMAFRDDQVGETDGE